MSLLEILILIVLAFSAYAALILLRKKRLSYLLQKLTKYDRDFKVALEDFHKLFQNNWYISDWQYQSWKTKYEYLAKIANPDILKLKTDNPIKKSAISFTRAWTNGRKLFIDDFNDKFILQESPRIKQLLDNYKIPCNADQIRAIASDENNTLLVAGAGTGKTTTILGKIIYLIKRAKIAPQEILVLSFTGNAVEELKERIAEKFSGDKIEILTFHSFGFSIIGNVLGRKPDLAFPESSDKKIFLGRQLDLLLEKRDYLSRAIEYFAYYFRPVNLKPEFEDFNEYFNYVKTEQNLTLKKERVKSYQEVMIANFLYINGINYEYEKPYEHKTSSVKYRQYFPDFYLPDHDVYIEHFGIDRKGKIHFTKNREQNLIHSKKYQSGMEWKRNLHKEHKTKLIETYSYEFQERNWREMLTKKLDKYGIKYSPRNIKEILFTLRSSDKIKQIVELIATFMDLCKSNGYNLSELEEIIKKRDNLRELAFFEILSPIFTKYENYLKQNNRIDFHDMLIKATQFVQENRYKAKFKYIIIDEFQDFSVSKRDLIKALCKQNQNTKLFCVGDDWQSIFRFAGSDISLMKNFEQSYGFTRHNKLTTTNRFNNQLATISNQFILKNPNQIEKQLKSEKNIVGDAIKIFSKKKNGDIERFLDEIIGSLDKRALENKKTATVFLLGRYKHNIPQKFAQLRQQYKNLRIKYLTVHAAKGGEADYVIIMDVISGKYGFPAEIADDPLLGIVLSQSDPYPYAEERRLMYVAMTRARNKVFVITENGVRSLFVAELEEFDPKSSAVHCKECGGKMVIRQSKYGAFYGCGNFPKCNYTESA